MPGDQVRICVDANLCIGAGQCELLEPEVFFLSDDDGLARVHDGAGLSRVKADAVIVQCPSGAISIEG